MDFGSHQHADWSRLVEGQRLTAQAAFRSGAADYVPSRRILHAGCGSEPLPPYIDGIEVRLDIDPATKPDIVANLDSLGDIGPFSLVWCSHAIEHLYPPQGVKALAEFRRVLEPGAAAIIVVPDCEGVAPTDEVLIGTPQNGITAHDLIYGCKPWENPHMAHKTAYTAESLKRAMTAAGFERIETKRLPHYNLMGIGHAPT